jgi:hypothetical protein
MVEVNLFSPPSSPTIHASFLCQALSWPACTRLARSRYPSPSPFPRDAPARRLQFTRDHHSTLRQLTATLPHHATAPDQCPCCCPFNSSPSSTTDGSGRYRGETQRQRSTIDRMISMALAIPGRSSRATDVCLPRPASVSDSSRPPRPKQRLPLK